MVNKRKNKSNNSSNGFSILLEEVRRKYGYRTPSEATATTGELWARLSQDEKDRYKQKAKAGKGALEKLDCFGNPVNSHTNKLKEQQEEKSSMENEIANLVLTLAYDDPKKKLAMHKFYFIHFNYFVDTGRVIVPSEVAISEYSLAGGISKVYHAFLNIMGIPGGYKSEARIRQRDIGIPIPELDNPHEAVVPETNPETVLLNIRNFVLGRNKDDYTVPRKEEMPPMYTIQEELKQVSACLQQLKTNLDYEFSFSGKVYPIHDLFYHLYTTTDALKGGQGFPVRSLSETEFERDPFTYVQNISCHFHEETDKTLPCSRSKVTRWGFLLSNFCCKGLDIELIRGKHCPSNAYINYEEFEPLGVHNEASAAVSNVESEGDLNIVDGWKPAKGSLRKARPNNYVTSSASNTSTGAIPKIIMPKVEHYEDDEGGSSSKNSVAKSHTYSRSADSESAEDSVGRQHGLPSSGVSPPPPELQHAKTSKWAAAETHPYPRHPASGYHATSPEAAVKTHSWHIPQSPAPATRFSSLAQPEKSAFQQDSYTDTSGIPDDYRHSPKPTDVVVKVEPGLQERTWHMPTDVVVKVEPGLQERTWHMPESKHVSDALFREDLGETKDTFSAPPRHNSFGSAHTVTSLNNQTLRDPKQSRQTNIPVSKSWTEYKLQLSKNVKKEPISTDSNLSSKHGININHQEPYDNNGEELDVPGNNESSSEFATNSYAALFREAQMIVCGGSREGSSSSKQSPEGNRSSVRDALKRKNDKSSGQSFNREQTGGEDTARLKLIKINIPSGFEH